MRVAITYAVVGWVIMQVAGLTFEGFGIPIWAFRFVMLCVILGFPIAIILAWAFELTPDGIKTTKIAQGTEISKAHAKKRNLYSLLFAAAVPTLIFGALSIFFYFRSDTSPAMSMSKGSSPNLSPKSQGLSESDKSIAVLPLANMSPDPNNAFFADGVHEDILTNLSRIDELRVISRTSTLRYRDTIKSLTEVSKELGVRYLVEGSVRRAGNQVRITVQLIDAQADDHLWAENYNRSLDDIFTIQADVAKEIADKLETVLTPKAIAQIERRPTENQEAYDLFVKVKQMIDSLSGTDEERIALLEKAAAIDPNFAEVWAQLAVERIDLWSNQERRNNPELLANAYHAFNQAKRLGPNLAYIPFVQYSIEWNEKQNYDLAISLLLEALAIDPAFRLAQSELADRYSYLGRGAEARHHHEAIHRTDPLSPRANNRLFSTYKVGLMWKEARELILRNLEWTDNPTQWRKRLAEVDYFQTGDKQAYISDMEAIPGFIESPSGKAWKAVMLRDYPNALRHIEELDPDEGFSLTGGVSLVIRPTSLVSALIYFETGDTEKQLIVAEKTRSYLEGRIEEDPLISPNYHTNLTLSYALVGDREKMDANIVITREQGSSIRWKYMFEAEIEFRNAVAYLVTGDHEAAIETLTKANELDYHDLLLKQELELWFIFDRLRGNPRFDALLKD